MCLEIDKTLIGMGLTTADVPTPRVSALMRLKITKLSPDVGPYKCVHTHTHTHTLSKENSIDGFVVLSYRQVFRKNSERQSGLIFQTI